VTAYLIRRVGTSLVILVAIPLGIFQAVKRNSFGDQAVTFVAFTT